MERRSNELRQSTEVDKMKRTLSMMRTNPFQKEEEQEVNSDLNQYNHNSQVLEDSSSLDDEMRKQHNDEASESSNGNQTPTLHASRGQE